MIRILLLLILLSFAILVFMGALSFAVQTVSEIILNLRSLRQRREGPAPATAGANCDMRPAAAQPKSVRTAAQALPATPAADAAPAGETAPAEAVSVNAQAASEAESLDVAQIATDRDGLITEFNRGAEALLGYGRDQAVGKINILDFYKSEELQVLTNILNSNLGRSLSPFATLVTECIDGVVEERSWIWVGSCAAEQQAAVTTEVIRNGLGQVEGFRFTARRVTEADLEQPPATEPVEPQLERVADQAAQPTAEEPSPVTPEDASSVN